MINKQLGERIKAEKKELDNLRPFSEASLKRLKENFMILLTHHSNAIEGNTLSLGETKLVLEEGITIGGKSLKDHLEVINHKKALDLLENYVQQKQQLNESMLCELNKIILTEIEDEEAGKYRIRKVYITGASFVPPKPDLIPKLMKQFFRWLNQTKKEETILFAAKLHEKITLIHPFIDGNGRVARLITNLFFMQQGYPPILILKTERKKYIQTLDQAHQGNNKPFAHFLARCMERSLAMYLEALKIPEKNEEYVLLDEATKWCNYSQEYLSLLARTGRIHAIKKARNWLTTKKAIDEYNLNNLKKLN